MNGQSETSLNNRSDGAGAGVVGSGTPGRFPVDSRMEHRLEHQRQSGMWADSRRPLPAIDFLGSHASVLRQSTSISSSIARPSTILSPPNTNTNTTFENPSLRLGPGSSRLDIRPLGRPLPLPLLDIHRSAQGQHCRRDGDSGTQDSADVDPFFESQQFVSSAPRPSYPMTYQSAARLSGGNSEGRVRTTKDN